jgi:rubrerythrin
MTTTVGTESRLTDLVRDLIQLDLAAAEAYGSAIEHVSSAAYKQQLTAFRGDHIEHTRTLGEWIRRQGETPPESGGAKQMLTTGKAALARLTGDKQILQAMKTNEDDTNTAYERASGHRDADGVRTVFEKNLSDERRHRAWIEATLSTLQ